MHRNCISPKYTHPQIVALVMNSIISSPINDMNCIVQISSNYDCYMLFMTRICISPESLINRYSAWIMYTINSSPKNDTNCII